ncbi:MAG: CBS domain-containing protein [Chloroflexi bacterium]|nr:CBS domain-containing protein [Chloroflexota bacterium]
MILVNMVLKTKGREIFTVEQGTPAIEALEIMAEKNIGALLVVDQKKPVGIFSERDFVRAVAKNKTTMLNMPVDSFMTKEIVSVTPSETIDECMAVMTKKHIRHLPVCESGQLVGLISIGDVVKQLIEDKDLLIDNMEKYILGRGYGQ